MAAPQHPINPNAVNMKVYGGPDEERMNYKIGPEGQFIPNNWLPIKHNTFRQPNANTNALRLYNLNAEPYNLNANNGSLYNYEFGGLARKILRGNEKTPRNTVTHWAQQVKEYWKKSNLNTRVEFTDREKRVIQFILNKPNEEIELETLRSFVRALISPSLAKLQGGKHRRTGRRATRKHRKSRKQTRRRRST